MHNLIRAILSSSVYDVAIETPLERMGHLSERLGRAVYLKREDLQPVYSQAPWRLQQAGEYARC